MALMMLCCLAGRAETGHGSDEGWGDELLGDINGDGRISIADLTRLIEMLRRGETTHQYVDLGLPSGTLWATTNVGASVPEGFGGYYAWGEVAEKVLYTWATYFDSLNGSSTQFATYRTDAETSIVGDAEHDVARHLWGSNWQMPTLAQLQELKTKCIWTNATVDGVNGVSIQGPNGNSIFMPKAGYKAYQATPYYQNTYFYYWAGELYCLYDDDASSSLACYMDASFTNAFAYHGISRFNGYPVRPVVAPHHFFPDCDINEDGRVDIHDVTALALMTLRAGAA